MHCIWLRHILAKLSTTARHCAEISAPSLKIGHGVRAGREALAPHDVVSRVDVAVVVEVTEEGCLGRADETAKYAVVIIIEADGDTVVVNLSQRFVTVRLD